MVVLNISDDCCVSVVPSHQLPKPTEMRGADPLSVTVTLYSQAKVVSRLSVLWTIDTTLPGSPCWGFPSTSMGFGSRKLPAIIFVLSRGQLSSPYISPQNRENLRSYPAGATVLMPPIATHTDLVPPCDRKGLTGCRPSHNIQTSLETYMHCKSLVPSPWVANLLPCIRRGERYKAST